MTVKTKGTSIKAITHSLMCEMQATPEYVGWLNALRETTDKLVRAEGENKRLQTQVTNAVKGKDLAQTMLAAEMAKHKTTRDKLATVEGEVRQLKTEVEEWKQANDSKISSCVKLLQEKQVVQVERNNAEENGKQLKREIKRLKHELHQSKANTQNIPTNDSQDALDSLKEYSQGRLLAEKYEKVLRQIADEDISSTKAFFASAKMKQWAKEVLGDE